MSVSFAEQQAIKLRRIEREERRQQKIHDRETKLAHEAGMTWLQWKIRQRDLEKLADFKDAIEIAKRDPELRAALLRELGCNCINQKALPAPDVEKL
jgi:hypothetical protein